MSRPLTFRDHILRSVWSDSRWEIPIQKAGVESAIILLRHEEKRVLLCVCFDGYADVSIIEPGRLPAIAEECNTTDAVAALWYRP